MRTRESLARTGPRPTRGHERQRRFFPTRDGCRAAETHGWLAGLRRAGRGSVCSLCKTVKKADISVCAPVPPTQGLGEEDGWRRRVVRRRGRALACTPRGCPHMARRLQTPGSRPARARPPGACPQRVPAAIRGTKGSPLLVHALSRPSNGGPPMTKQTTLFRPQRAGVASHSGEHGAEWQEQPDAAESLPGLHG